MRQAGTSEEWRDVGSAEGFSVALEVNEPVPILTGGFTFSTKGWDPEVLKLYYGTDIVNNRGEARKEEKHMGVREFKGAKHPYDRLRISRDRAPATKGGEGVYVEVAADGSAWFEKADVPLIAHALFEKSGWPTAKEDSVGDWEVETPDGSSTWGFKVRSDKEATGRLLDIIANLAAYNAWMKGEADRRAKAEEAAKAAEEEEARRKREHDELRTSPIALEALKLYNDCGLTYESWDAVNGGDGCSDDKVRYWVEKAEAARDAKPAPKVGDRVRVSAEGVRASGAFAFAGAVEGVVSAAEDSAGDIKIKASTFAYPEGINQYIKSKYVTVLATAEEVAAEKAKAERDAGIAAIRKAATADEYTATHLYDRGIRATA